MSYYFEVAASAFQALGTIKDESVRLSPVCLLKSCSDPSGQNIFLLMLLCCLQREDQCNKSMREHTLPGCVYALSFRRLLCCFPVSIEFGISMSVIIATLSILFSNHGRQLLCHSSMRPVCLVSLPTTLLWCAPFVVKKIQIQIRDDERFRLYTACNDFYSVSYYIPLGRYLTISRMMGRLPRA